MDPKISVIVPVYNPGNYLKYCIDSLLSQTLKECEFIFINDGSTDQSLEILNSYKKNDSRIIILDQKNTGISIARNNGIKIAKGEYIGFCDNDDYLEFNMLDVLYRAAKDNDCEIVVSKYFLGRDKKELITGAAFQTQTVFKNRYIREKIIPNLLEKEDMFAVWNKIYKRDFILKNQIFFPPNRSIEEDGMFNIGAFNLCESVIFLDYCGYHFREMSSSESRNFFEKDFFILALEKYHFNYKVHFNLDITDQNHENLKVFRLVNRVFYLTFITSVSKKAGYFKKYEFLKKMIFNTELFEIVESKHQDIKTKVGLYEKTVLLIIKYRLKSVLLALIVFVSLAYKPGISEILRKFNK